MGFGPFDTEVFPLVAVIRTLDTAATEAASGYDPLFREPLLTDSDDDQIGEPDTVFGDEIRLIMQQESDDQERLTMGPGGNLPGTFITLSVFRSRLEENGWLGADGNPTIKVGARLVRIEAVDGEKQWTYGTSDEDGEPRWLHLEEIRMADAHLAGRNNFFLTEWRSRKEGPTT
jgi:hypothetical protein